MLALSYHALRLSFVFVQLVEHRDQSPSIRDAQPALVIGLKHITERDSVPVQYIGIV